MVEDDETNTADASLFTAIDSLLGVAGYTTCAVTFKPLGPGSCVDLTADDTDANACKTLTITDLADCNAKNALATTASLTDNT